MPDDLFDRRPLAGQSAIVAGASSGIGAGIAGALEEG
jgi:NAD(P)-dependent dehydrogenase (short-subunit alcohol dehydrogenase family)